MLKYLRVKWWWYGLPKWHHGKENASAGDSADVGSIQGLGRFPGIGSILA